jgi:hypothetical protein
MTDDRPADGDRCSSCQTELTAPGPCPACAKTGRTMIRNIDDHVGLTDTANVGMRWVKDRPWSDKWAAVLRGLDGVERIYAGTWDTTDTEAMKEVFRTVCSDVYTLKDWLITDDVASKVVVDDWVHRMCARTLRAAGGVTNTWKHKGTRKNMPSAYIVGMKTTTANPGVRFTVEVDDPLYPPPWNEDARQLAVACVQDWRTFFGDHNLRAE